MGHLALSEPKIFEHPNFTARDFVVVVLMGSLGALAAFPFVQEDYVVGRDRKAYPTPDDRMLIVVEDPWDGSKEAVLLRPEQLENALEPGHWLVCRGNPRFLVDDDIRVLEVSEEIVTFGWIPCEWLNGDVSGNVVEFFREHSFLAAVLGMMLILAGSYFVRLLSCIGTGCFMAIIVCLAAVVGHFEGFLKAPVEDYLVVFALFGFILGCVIAGWRGNGSSFIAERISLFLLLYIFAEEISQILNWPGQATVCAGIFATLLSPLIGVSILSGSLIAIGTGAEGLAVAVILVLAVGETFLVHRGEWRTSIGCRHRGSAAHFHHRWRWHSNLA